MKKYFLKKIRFSVSAPLSIILTYIVLGGIWISVSDLLLEKLAGPIPELTILQTFKGWFFVIATALLLYWLIRRGFFELEKSTQELRENEERLNLALYGTDQALWDWNIKKDKIFFNEKWANMLGYELVDIEGKYNSWENLVHPADLPKVLDLLNNHLEGNSTIYEAQYRLQTKAGDWKWVLDLGKVVERDSAGEPIRMIGTHRDITAQIQAEKALLQSQRTLSTLMSNLPGMAYRCRNDEERTMEFVSEGCVNLTGYPSRDLTTNRKISYARLIHPDDRQRVWEEVQKCLAANRPFQLIYRIVAANDQTKWVWEKGRQILIDGNAQGILEGFITDITERVKAQESLAIRNLQYENFIQNNLVGIWRLEFPEPISAELPPRQIARKVLETGYFTEGNDALLKMYKISSKSDWVGKAIKNLIIDWDTSLDRLENVIRNNFKAEILDNEEKDFDGNIHYFRNSYFGYVEEEKLLWMWGIQLDITEQKKLEEQYLQSQKMEAIGKLAGGIAHDFNNLMTVVTGYSEVLLNQLDNREQLFSGISSIKKAGERAASLTRQLLAFSRRQIIQPKTIALNYIVHDIYKILKRLIGEDIELNIDLGNNLDKVRVDAGQIEQVIMNLAVNARDAMPNGGKLTIETESVYLDETYARRHMEVDAGQYVMLAVSDTGVGMDEKTRERIFEPFFTTKTKDRGTGLGLSTVYGIIKQSGGHIWVYSEPEHGTSFKIYFPAIRSDNPPSVEKKEKAGLIRGSETVLVVEDEEDVRTLIYEILKSTGYEVLEAGSADEAINFCRNQNNSVNLILTDVIMPKMNGPELVKKCAEFRKDLKILYLSGYTNNTIINHGVLEAGVTFLQKPFTAENLLNKVREALNSSSHDGWKKN